MIVDWMEPMPTEVRVALEPMLNRWMPLLPTWVQSLSVEYEAESANVMHVRTHYTNRWAVIGVTGSWLKYDDTERQNALRHELVHVCVEPLRRAARNAVEATAEEGPTRALALKTLEEGLESAVEDLAQCIGRLDG